MHAVLHAGEQRSGPRLPTFLIIGAPKAGTTSIYEWLRQHPQVHLCPVKEPHWFLFQGDVPEPSRTPQLDPRARELRTLEDYKALFAGAYPGRIAFGEASTGYLGNPSAVEAIQTAVPEVRLVAMLRDPVERAWSYWSMRRRAGVPLPDDFAQFVREAPQDGTVRGGRYGQALARWYDLFPSDQIAVYRYDDLVSDPQALMRRLLGHIGVNPARRIDTRRAYNRRPDTARIPPDAARYLRDLYAEDLRLTERLTGLDLSAWREGPKPSG
jgi:hypothetical protein